MICPNCQDINMESVDGVLTCPKCKAQPKTYITIDDLSTERRLRSKGEAEAVVAEIRRIIRMMKLENTIDYATGFFNFMKIREDKLLDRIKEVKQEMENFNE